MAPLVFEFGVARIRPGLSDFPASGFLKGPSGHQRRGGRAGEPLPIRSQCQEKAPGASGCLSKPNVSGPSYPMSSRGQSGGFLQHASLYAVWCGRRKAGAQLQERPSRDTLLFLTRFRSFIVRA
jgi:hypothetical protein